MQSLKTLHMLTVARKTAMPMLIDRTIRKYRHAAKNGFDLISLPLHKHIIPPGMRDASPPVRTDRAAGFHANPADWLAHDGIDETETRRTRNLEART